MNQEPKNQKTNRVMDHIKTQGNLRTHLARIILVSSITAGGGMVGAQGWQLATNLTLKADVTLKETFDSNIYLQDNKPIPFNVLQAEAAGLHPVEANKGSFVTTVTPKVGLDYKPSAAFNLSAAYAPEAAFYHSAPDFHAQRAARASLGGDLQREFQTFPLRHAGAGGLERGGRAFPSSRFIDLAANRRVRTNGHALQALDANAFVPDGNIQRQIALLVLSGGGGERAVVRERAHGQVVAQSGGEFAEHIRDEARRVRRDG